MLTRKTNVSLAIVAFALCYAGELRTLALTWATSYAYSYGIAVLALSAYMIWMKVDHVRTLKPEPDCLLGIPLTFGGIALLVAGRLALVASLQHASVVVTVAGLILLLFGRGVFAIVRFPLAYLLLGLPIWDRAISWLQPPSQLLSAKAGAVLLQLLGIPVLQDGTQLGLPNVTLDVMRECSGVNQLLAIVAMALPAAYLLLRSRTRRAIFVGLAVFFAYASNGVRIALVGFLAYRGLSNGDLKGMHLFEGLAISAIGYLLLLWCLSQLTKGERTADSSPAVDERRPQTPGVRQARLELGTLVVVLIIGVLQAVVRPAEVRLVNDLTVFPSQIGDWTRVAKTGSTTDQFPGIDDELVHAHAGAEGGARRFLGIDDELVREYRDASGQRLRLYIGYHRQQSEGKELTGEAAHLLGAASTPVVVKVGSGAVEVGQVTQDFSNRARGLLFWYDVNGRVFSDLYLAKKYLVLDALTRARTNGAVVMVAWESDAVDAESTRLKAAAFAQAILGVLPEFIPS